MSENDLTAATAAVLSRQKPEEVMSGLFQKAGEVTHLNRANI